MECSLLIEFLTRLLPVECCEVRLYSDFYLETYECNFLGLSPNAQIPSHISPSSTFFIGNFYLYSII